MIDATPGQLQTVKGILARYAPGREARAFGSRVTGAAKPYSDLDLAVCGDRALDFDSMRLLKEAFEESDLPFRVDIIDWNEISEGFQRLIEARFEVVQEAAEK